MRFHYGQDAPLRLLESALEYATQVLPDPDFFLYTGDHVAHIDVTDEYLENAVATNVHTIEKYYPPTVQSGRLETTAIIGNADGNPDYHMEITDPDKETNPSIELISKPWNGSLSPSNLDLFTRRGYLELHLEERLAVLSLNTVPYSPSHVPDTSSLKDPFGQFKWLNETLTRLRSEAKFAYIVGHIAPFVDSYGGNPQWHEHYIETYKELVGRFSDVVKAQLFGHVHSIEFRLPRQQAAPSSHPLAPLFVTGSVSPFFKNNPSFMVWEYDPSTFDLLDFVVYGSNLSEADQNLEWAPLFRATESYGVPSLSSHFLADFVERVKTNMTLLDEFYWNMKAQSHQLPPCDNNVCQAKTLCTMQWWTSKQEFSNCVQHEIERLNHTSHVAVTPLPADIRASSFIALSSHDVLQILAWTVGSTLVLIVGVVLITRGLLGCGIVKSAEDRAEEYEDVYPLL